MPWFFPGMAPVIRHSRLFLVAGIFAVIAHSGVVLGEPKADSPAASAGPLDLSAEVWVSWIDRLSRSTSSSAVDARPSGTDSGSSAQVDAPAPRTDNGQRTLGLTRARILADWASSPQTRLSLVLRPDVGQLPRTRDPNSSAGSADDAAGSTSATTQSERESDRDFDRRAGDVYAPRPSVELLDAWQVSWRAGAALEMGLGVWEELAPIVAAYPQVLEFGLGVDLPAKFSAVRAQWTPRKDFTGSVWILEGRDDRVNRFDTSKDTFDTAPQSQDPWLGAVLDLGWQVADATSLHASVGYLPTALVGAKYREAWARLTVERTVGRVMAFGRSKMAADLRWTRGTIDWNDAGSVELPRTSASVTVSGGFADKGWVLLGTHYGQSMNLSPVDRTKALPTTGWQVDSGILWEMSPGLEGIVSTALESRETEDSDGKSGGAFGSAGQRIEDRERMIRRVALELRYQIGG